MTTPLSLLAVILQISAAAAGAGALVLDVPSGSSKCLTEILRRGARTRASYRVAGSTPAADPAISARVTGPRGEELHLAEGVGRGGFRFEAAEGGEHIVCFWTPHYERGAVASVDVLWEDWDTSGVRAHDQGSRPTNQGRIASMAGELEKLEASARHIHEEMVYLCQSEREMQKLNEDTAIRIQSFTMLSLAVCLGVAGLQLWHLKSFFQKQHIP